MDKVRFGRALGKGARAAAKSVWEAADAAASPDPSPRRTPQPEVVRPSPSPAARPSVSQVKAAGKAAGKSALAPVKKFTSVVWLQVTGTFFTIIAVFLAQGAWKLHRALHTSNDPMDLRKFYIYCGVMGLFVYFAATSFIRASRRGRRP